MLPGPAEQQPAAAGLPTGQPHAAAEGSPGPAGGPASPSSGGSSGGSSGEGALSVMTLLVMEYCSLGSLHRAIAAGRFFLDRRAKLPNLVRWPGVPSWGVGAEGSGRGAPAQCRPLHEAVPRAGQALHPPCLVCQPSCRPSTSPPPASRTGQPAPPWTSRGGWPTCTASAGWCTATCPPTTCCWRQTPLTRAGSGPSCPTSVSGAGEALAA